MIPSLRKAGLLVAFLLSRGCGPMVPVPAMLAGATTVVACTELPQPATLSLDRDVLAANYAITILETSQATAVALYRIEQSSALDEARSKGENRDAATARISTIRAKWLPVWQAFGKAREAEAVLVKALKTYRAEGDAKKGVFLQAVSAFSSVVSDAVQLLKPYQEP